MKKIYQIIMLCAIAVALVSCDSIKKSRLNDALENNDFVKAYQYAKALEESNQGEDFLSEVIKKEAQYVLDNQGEAGLVRISMIVNEHNASWVYLDVLKMAISMGDESIATKLYKMSDACDEEAMDYAITADMEELVNTFISKNLDFIDKQNVIEYLKEKGTYDKLYLSKLSKEIDALASQAFPTRPALGITKSDHYGQIMTEYTSYRSSVEKFNAECRKLLGKTIIVKNLSLAKKIVAMVRASIAWNDLGDWCKVVEHEYDHSSVYEAYKVTEDNSEKKAVQQLLNEAIRNGSFNTVD